MIGLAGVIRGEVALSFLGLVVQRPTPSWSRVLRDGFQYLATAPWVSLAPGAAIFLTVFVFHQLGDLIRDTLDPRALSRTKAA